MTNIQGNRPIGASLHQDMRRPDVKPVSQIRRTMPESMTIAPTNAPIVLSDRAAEEIKKIMNSKEIPEGFGLRVGVRGGGCSGMNYILGFDKMREHDLQFQVDNIPLFIDKRHGLYLYGTTVDYQDGLNARGFTFDNPNATSTCGCGSSFAA